MKNGELTPMACRPLWLAHLQAFANQLDKYLTRQTTAS